LWEIGRRLLESTFKVYPEGPGSIGFDGWLISSPSLWVVFVS
jgi:hypothetical protein